METTERTVKTEQNDLKRNGEAARLGGVAQFNFLLGSRTTPTPTRISLRVNPGDAVGRESCSSSYISDSIWKTALKKKGETVELCLGS